MMAGFYFPRVSTKPMVHCAIFNLAPSFSKAALNRFVVFLPDHTSSTRGGITQLLLLGQTDRAQDEEQLIHAGQAQNLKVFDLFIPTPTTLAVRIVPG